MEEVHAGEKSAKPGSLSICKPGLTVHQACQITPVIVLLRSIREPRFGMFDGVLALTDTQVLLKLDGQAAAARQRLAGDERGFVRAQEHDGVRNVHGNSGAAQRILLFEEAQSIRMVLPLLLA